MIVVLPWPPSPLHPNNRVHWAVRARAAKAYRTECWARTLEALQTQAKPAGETLSVRLTFVPPTRRRHDADNMVAAMKSGLDGIADALGVDDSTFRLEAPEISGDVGGMVRVEVSAEFSGAARRPPATPG